MRVTPGSLSRRRLMAAILAIATAAGFPRGSAGRTTNGSGRPAGGQVAAAVPVGQPKTTGEILDYLRSLDGGWVDRDRTVDTFKSGGPSEMLSGIAVGWMSDRRALQRAKDLGCNLFITHEPTFYNHFDFEEDIFRNWPAADFFKVDETFADDAVRQKRRFIDASGMTILRCHDLWDQVPGMGITDAWASQLGFADPVAGEGFFRVFDVSGRDAGSVARQVAERTKSLGQEAVHLIGNEDSPVTRVVIGCGAITPMFHMIALYRADCVICSDDGFVYWRDGPMAEDMGIPIVIAHHGVTEGPGMRMLAEHLAEQFPETPVHFISQPCMYRLIQV